MNKKFKLGIIFFIVGSIGVLFILKGIINKNENSPMLVSKKVDIISDTTVPQQNKVIDSISDYIFGFKTELKIVSPTTKKPNIWAKYIWWTVTKTDKVTGKPYHSISDYDCKITIEQYDSSGKLVRSLVKTQGIFEHQYIMNLEKDTVKAVLIAYAQDKNAVLIGYFRDKNKNYIEVVKKTIENINFSNGS